MRRGWLHKQTSFVFSSPSSNRLPRRVIPLSYSANSGTSRLFSGSLSRDGWNNNDSEQENLWHDLLADPSNWLDKRPGKWSPRSPDFKHKETGKFLWLDSKRTPEWVLSEVVALFGNESEKVEKLWRDVFADPSNWWDNRSGKGNRNLPDFKHKKTGDVLLVDNKCTPPWVKSGIISLKSSNHEQKWRELFSKPSEWWDHRPRKRNPRFPDFIHKLSRDGLWLDGKQTPSWVGSKVDCLGPGMLQIDVISSVERLSLHNKAGEFAKTLDLFEQMQKEGINPDLYIFLHVLHACAAVGDLEEGRCIHEQIIDTGWELHPHISNSLVDMYAKCGNLEDARKLFNKMPNRDVVSWNAFILGFVKCGQGLGALEVFQDMQRVGVEADSTTFVAVLNACASIAALDEGRRVHEKLFRSGCESNRYVGNALVDMYAKCGSIEDAKAVFNKMPTRDVVSWNALILGFFKCGEGRAALNLYQEMQRHGVEPDSTTFVAVLNACASMAALEEGRQVHNQAVQRGFESNEYVGSALVDMYAKCGNIEDAKAVFDKMFTRNVVCWNALILGFVKCEQGVKALELFQEMQRFVVEPDSTTFVALLNACASMGALEEGRGVHNQILRSGCESNAYVSNALIDMYAKCGSIRDAQAVFDKMPTRNVVSWTAMIVGLRKCGEGLAALELYQQMQLKGVEPDSTTFVALLNACASVAALEEGRRVHSHVIRAGFESISFVGTSLVDMYAKCGSVGDAKRVFDKMPTRDVVSWNAMILAFAMHGLGKEAVTLFEQMSRSGCEMNEITFINLLSACNHGGLVKEGLQYFERMQAVYGVAPTQEHYSCMVDILGRAGHLDDAEALIRRMPLEPSAAVWKSLLAACRIHGNLEVGERAAQQVLKLDPENAAGYVLLANIHAAAGNFDWQKSFNSHMVEEN